MHGGQRFARDYGCRDEAITSVVVIEVQQLPGCLRPDSALLGGGCQDVVSAVGEQGAGPRLLYNRLSMAAHEMAVLLAEHVELLVVRDLEN